MKMFIAFAFVALLSGISHAQRVRPRVTPKVHVSTPKPTPSRPAVIRTQTAKQLSQALQKPNVRGGKQQRLRELSNDPSLGKAARGSLKQDMAAVQKGQRKSIRVPNGHHLVHPRGQEAAKGHDYRNAKLNTIELHRLQHKYDQNGRLQRQRR